MSKSIFVRANTLPERWVLPTPSLGLNRALNGGFRSGMIHTLWGSKASGKTTIALHVIAAAQKMGKRAVFIDAEKTFTNEWAERCGVDLSELDICFRSRVGQILTELLPKVIKDEVDVIVVDSLSSIYFEDFFDKPENHAIGYGARPQNLFVSKLLEAMDPMNTQVFLIAHQTNKDSAGGFSLQPKISESVQMWSASMVKFYKSLAKEEYRDVPNRMTIRWDIEKSKWSNYPVKGTYHLWAKPDEDVYIDNIGEITSEAIEDGIFIKSGSWFKYGDRTFHGEAGITKSLREDEILLAKIRGELKL